MTAFLRRLKYRIRRFERWFERHLGWYFTNGMKHDRLMDMEKQPPQEVPKEHSSGQGT